MENQEISQERAEFERNEARLSQLREEESHIENRQAGLINMMENEARLLNGIFDVHDKFPELPSGENSVPPEYIAAMRQEIRKLSIALNNGLVEREDDQWLNRVSPELNALAAKEDLTKEDIDHFQALYGEMELRRETLAERLANKNIPTEGVEEKIFSAEDIFALKEERERIFRDPALEEEVRMERMQEVDALRAQLIARDAKLYAEYNRSNPENTDSSERNRVAMSDLARTVSEVHYASIKDGSTVRHIEMIEPGTEFFDGEGTGDQKAPNFIIKYDGGVVTDNVARYNLRLYEPYSKNTGHREHAACVEVDPISGEVRSVVVPEAIWEERPRTLLPAVKDVDYLRHRTVTALNALLQIPRYIPTQSSGRTIEPSGKYRLPEGHETQLFDERKSSIRFRRRKVFPGDLSSIDTLVSEFLEKWSPEERSVLETIGGGKIKLAFYANHGGKEEPYYHKLPDLISEDDMVGLRKLLEESFAQGASDITVVCEGGWIDRVRKNEGPATSPKSHTRRVRGQFIIALNRGDVSPEKRALQEKFKSGAPLSNDERQHLMEMLNLDNAALDAMLTQNGIHFKDGRWSETPNSKHVPKYIMPRSVLSEVDANNVIFPEVSLEQMSAELASMSTEDIQLALAPALLPGESLDIETVESIKRHAHQLLTERRALTIVDALLDGASRYIDSPINDGNESRV